MRAVLAIAALTASLGAHAAADAPPRDRLSLSASASAEVARDLLGVTFSTTREGTDAAAVQTALKQALDAALAEARKVAKPGQVDVQTGGFSLTPRYDPKTAKITGWQGSAELLVEGRDATAIAQLAGRINTLSIARVGYSLSREAREKVEGEVAAQAIARFRAKAADYARAFGYTTFTVRDATVNIDNGQPQPRPFRMKATMASSLSEALPVEAGSGSVTANVNGSVQLK